MGTGDMVGHALGTIGDTQRVWWDAWRVWGACTAHRDTPEGAGVSLDKENQTLG